MARITGGRYEGCEIQMRHEWTLGRGHVEIDGPETRYRVSTDEHGFVMVWIKPTEAQGGR